MQPDQITEEANRRKTAVAEAQIDIGGQTHRFRFFESSRGLVGKILSGETYPILPFIEDVRTILDIGASVGTASIYFHSRYPDASIWAFEPHSRSFELLSSNLAPIAGAKAFNIGLFDRSAESELHLSKYDFPTNSIGACVYNSGEREVIRLEPARAFAQAQGIERIDILKVDTEGCEIPILTDLLADYAPRVIYLEYHSDRDRLKIDQMLARDYLLYAGQIPYPHRGELCYVARDAIPPDHGPLRLEIVVDGDGG